MRTKAWHTFLFVFLAVFMVFSVIATVSIGATELPVSEVYGVLLDKLFHGGEQISAGSTVYLSVSSGVQISYVRMPNLIGLSEAAAF